MVKIHVHLLNNIELHSGISLHYDDSVFTQSEKHINLHTSLVWLKQQLTQTIKEIETSVHTHTHAVCIT